MPSSSSRRKSAPAAGGGRLAMRTPGKSSGAPARRSTAAMAANGSRSEPRKAPGSRHLRPGQRPSLAGSRKRAAPAEDDDEDEDEDEEEVEVEDAMNGANGENGAEEGEVGDALELSSADRKELDIVLGDMGPLLTQTRDQVDSDLLTRVREGQLPTAAGISFLELKNHLLLAYNTALAFVMTLKLEGRSIEGHPVVERLARLRVLLERIRPIDQKLKYQVDKVVKLAKTGISSTEDPLRFRPNPENLIPKDGAAMAVGEGAEDDEDGEAAAAAGDAGVYQPPKLAAVQYEEDETATARRERFEAKERRRLASSRMMQELQEELSDRPRAIGLRDEDVFFNDAKKKKERQVYEEDNFTRLSLSKRERQRGKVRRGNELDHIANFDSHIKASAYAAAPKSSMSMKQRVADVRKGGRPQTKRKELRPSKKMRK